MITKFIKKCTIYNVQFTICFIFTFYILHSTFYISPVLAQTCATGNQATGLISSGQTGGINNFGNQIGQGGSGVCAADPKAGFVEFAIPSYDKLFNDFYNKASSVSTNYTKNKINKSAINTDLDFGSNKIYWITGNLDINSNFNGDKIGVIFVDGNLNIRANYTRANTENSGTVFIVRGDVNINRDSSVTTIEAVIISNGVICTAFDFTTGSCSSSLVITNPLLINGSLISINKDPNKKIRFKRSLINNNAVAAEKIVHQPKYLVILRDILSEPLQRWTEIQ